MTEQEWLASENVKEMLSHLTTMSAPDWAERYERKLRYWACACARQVWDKLLDQTACPNCDAHWLNESGRSSIYDHSKREWVVCPVCGGTGGISRSRRAVEMSEQFADGLISEQKLEEVWNAALSVDHSQMWVTFTAARCAEVPRYFHLTPRVIVNNLTGKGTGRGVTPSFMASLLRDVVGNPFQTFCWPLINYERFVTKIGTTNARCLICGYVACGEKIERNHRRYCCPYLTPQVKTLAQAAYDNRILPAGTLDPLRLTVLADSLEDAGCDHSSLLGHLREQHLHGDEYCHIRGCWALDRLLSDRLLCPGCDYE